ncbi:MAG: DEAD/DEAH box helicase family protein, partial [Candidatus Altiarchaeota archaeon]
MDFALSGGLAPKGDQPKAIEGLVDGLRQNTRFQTLLGVTGSGKTYTMANVIAKANKPALVISPNKTLAAQLYSEFKDFFPGNAVEYFVSYYDYYQPEAYIPSSDTYIDKDADINKEIEKLRHSATRSLLDREDVLVVSSVSCIYGLGSPQEYKAISLRLDRDQETTRKEIITRLVEMQYSRNDLALEEGRFRVRGSTIDVYSPYATELVRVKLEDKITKITRVDPVSGKAKAEFPFVRIYPATHYVLPKDKKDPAIEAIQEELAERLSELKRAGKLLEAQRLEQRTSYDLEMMEHVGYCKGIENYSRHLDGRNPGEPPHTLLDF